MNPANHGCVVFMDERHAKRSPRLPILNTETHYTGLDLAALRGRCLLVNAVFKSALRKPAPKRRVEPGLRLESHTAKESWIDLLIDDHAGPHKPVATVSIVGMDANCLVPSFKPEEDAVQDDATLIARGGLGPRDLVGVKPWSTKYSAYSAVMILVPSTDLALYHPTQGRDDRAVLQ